MRNKRGARSKLLEANLRRKIEQYLDAGYSVAKTAKLTGTSYKHAKQIAEQRMEEKMNKQGRIWLMDEVADWRP